MNKGGKCARDAAECGESPTGCGRASSPRRNMAERAGERVSALKAEMAMENAIVSENWRYRIPVVPGKNETGTKTAISTSEVAMTALVTSPMARDVASCGSECSIAMWRCTFSMTTMASSTTRPVARVIPNSVSELIEKPKILDEREGADERNRNGDSGNDGGAPIKQEQKDDRRSRWRWLREGDQDFADGVADDGGRVESDRIFKSRRKTL